MDKEKFIKNNYIEINLGDADKKLADYTNITKNILCFKIL